MCDSIKDITGTWGGTRTTRAAPHRRGLSLRTKSHAIDNARKSCLLKYERHARMASCRPRSSRRHLHIDRIPARKEEPWGRQARGVSPSRYALSYCYRSWPSRPAPAPARGTGGGRVPAHARRGHAGRPRVRSRLELRGALGLGQDASGEIADFDALYGVAPDANARDGRVVERPQAAVGERAVPPRRAHRQALRRAHPPARPAHLRGAHRRRRRSHGGPPRPQPLDRPQPDRRAVHRLRAGGERYPVARRLHLRREAGPLRS